MTLLADDHTLISAAFADLLQPICNVVDTAGDGLALVAAAEQHKPELILLDVSMPRLNGIDAARRLKKTQPKCKLIFLTMNDDPDIAAEAFRIGASGYLLKVSRKSELFEAVGQVMAGRTYITPLIAEGMMRAMTSKDRDNCAESITLRQREVLQLLAEGNSMKEAARCLKISQRTVAFHKYRIMEQFKLKSSAELIRFAVKKGIVAA